MLKHAACGTWHRSEAPYPSPRGNASLGRMNDVAPTVLLDLDGTLIDSADGILGALREAFDEVGVPWPEGEISREILGPPLHVTLPRIVGAHASTVLSVYRRIYVERGLIFSPPFEGVPELLTSLTRAGMRLAVATSKAEPHAQMIVAEHGWTDLFETVRGDTLDAARPNKAAVVAEALRRLGEPDGAVMVGDRHLDVVGARANGLPCFGAGWGYGGPDELENAGAAAVFSTPAELATALHNLVTPRSNGSSSAAM